MHWWKWCHIWWMRDWEKLPEELIRSEKKKILGSLVTGSCRLGEPTSENWETYECMLGDTVTDANAIAFSTYSYFFGCRTRKFMDYTINRLTFPYCFRSAFCNCLFTFDSAWGFVLQLTCETPQTCWMFFLYLNCLNKSDLTERVHVDEKRPLQFSNSYL